MAFGIMGSRLLPRPHPKLHFCVVVRVVLGELEHLPSTRVTGIRPFGGGSGRSSRVACIFQPRWSTLRAVVGGAVRTCGLMPRRRARSVLVCRISHAQWFTDVLLVGAGAGVRRRCHAPSLIDVLLVGFWRGLASSLPRAVVHTRGPRRFPAKRVAEAAEGNAPVTSPVSAARFPWDGGRVEVRRLVLTGRLERECGEVRVAGNVGRTSRAACVGAVGASALHVGLLFGAPRQRRRGHSTR